MSDAPERVWARTGLYWNYVNDWSEGAWGLSKDDGPVQYIRKDVSDALVEAAREEALRDALSEIQHMVYGEDCRKKILALIEKDKTDG